jgi:Adenylate and Guanylate cyclase catalytic domain
MVWHTTLHFILQVNRSKQRIMTMWQCCSVTWSVSRQCAPLPLRWTSSLCCSRFTLNSTSSAASWTSTRCAIHLSRERRSSIGCFFSSWSHAQVETIGDAYCAAGGLHRVSNTHAQQIAWLALCMLQACRSHKTKDGQPIKVIQICLS